MALILLCDKYTEGQPKPTSDEVREKIRFIRENRVVIAQKDKDGKTLTVDNDSSIEALNCYIKYISYLTHLFN